MRMLFSIVFSWLLLMPLFPLSKLILRHHMYTADTSWLQLFFVLALVSCMMNAYAFMCISGLSLCMVSQKLEYD